MINFIKLGQISRNFMETQPHQNKVYFHYDHTDSCKFSRWTAKESYQYMYARPWQKVNDFYSEMVQGRVSLSDLFKKEIITMNTTWRVFQQKIGLEGGQELHSRYSCRTMGVPLMAGRSSLVCIQCKVERSLGKFVDDKKTQLLKEQNLPIEGCAVVAGRTDKGVTAFQQVCSFYTWRKDVKPQDIKDAINDAVPGKINVISVAEVSREFHPNFSAKWRRYMYIFPFNDGEEAELGSQVEKHINECSDIIYAQNLHGNSACMTDYGLDDGKDEMETGNKPTSFEVSRVNQLLSQLEGKLLSYKMFARDTKASRNIGPPTECFVFHARAAEAILPCTQGGNDAKVMCIELVANRFLRKMVRVLVATAVREAAAGAEEDALLKLMHATCRRATAPPSPPDGLCLVDVGYTDFNRKNCFIS